MRKIYFTMKWLPVNEELAHVKVIGTYLLISHSCSPLLSKNFILRSFVQTGLAVNEITLFFVAYLTTISISKLYSVGWYDIRSLIRIGKEADAL
jgi:hypothetical protein